MTLEWFVRRGGPGRRLDRFRAVLDAAACSPEWTTALRSAGAGTVKLRRQTTDVEAILERLPLSMPEPSLVAFPRARFEPPYGSERIAFLDRRYPMAAGWRSFSGGNAGALAEFAPDTVTGSANAILRMADAGLLPPVSHSLVILTGPGDGELTVEARDRLWHLVGVPIFERWTGPDGQTIAGECVAHDGLHLEEDNAVVECCGGRLILTSLTSLDPPALRVNTGWTAEFTDEPCGCGRAGRRMRAFQPLVERKGVRREVNAAMAMVAAV
jgi:hypothetical protein